MNKCAKCEELIGHFSNSPQFNCRDCWDILQGKMRSLKAQLEVAEKCVEFYADEDNWSLDEMDVDDNEMMDGGYRSAGKRAREAKAEIAKMRLK